MSGPALEVRERALNDLWDYGNGHENIVELEKSTEQDMKHGDLHTVWSMPAMGMAARH